MPLAPAALEILDSLPRHAGGDYIFSTMGGKRPISGFSKMKARLDAAAATLAEESEAAPVEPYTLHDLRRTMRTGLSSEGVAPMIAALTIGHKQTGVLAIYDRHRYDGEKRAALEAWERKLKAIVAPEPTPGVVVRLPARARARA